MRVVVGMLLVMTATASADPGITETAAEPPRRHLVYAELLGKGGAYGVGYEHGITPRLSLGIAGSFAVLGGQHLYTVTPYLHATLIRGRRHAMFGELGFAVIHSRLPSPVPEWDGMTSTDAGGQSSLGWEWRPGRLVVRASGGVTFGHGGVAPIVGIALGATL